MLRTTILLATAALIAPWSAAEDYIDTQSQNDRQLMLDLMLRDVQRIYDRFAIGDVALLFTSSEETAQEVKEKLEIGELYIANRDILDEQQANIDRNVEQLEAVKEEIAQERENLEKIREQLKAGQSQLRVVTADAQAAEDRRLRNEEMADEARQEVAKLNTRVKQALSILDGGTNSQMVLDKPARDIPVRTYGDE